MPEQQEQSMWVGITRRPMEGVRERWVNRSFAISARTNEEATALLRLTMIEGDQIVKVGPKNGLVNIMEAYRSDGEAYTEESIQVGAGE